MQIVRPGFGARPGIEDATEKLGDVIQIALLTIERQKLRVDLERPVTLTKMRLPAGVASFCRFGVQK